MSMRTARLSEARRCRRWVRALAAGLIVATGASPAAAADDPQALVDVDRFVPHVSTVPAIAGRRVGLFLHERVRADLAPTLGSDVEADGRVVLFVHGMSVPTVPGFDLPFDDYSWMAALARAGFDAFSMDLSGYGFSPRPTMDDPCNLTGEERRVALGSSAPSCEPSHPFQLTTSQTEWDEMDSVVDYIRQLRNVDRVSLVGWSQGGTRVAGYAERHPEKVNRLVLFAPAYFNTPDAAADPAPQPGRPVRLQTKDALLDQRWRATAECARIAPGIQEAAWQSILSFDPYGAAWAPPEGVMRVVGNTSFGVNEASVGRITAPTLILVGMEDGLLRAGETLYTHLTGIKQKVLAKMACATHFANWEATQYHFMHAASIEWLAHGTFRGETTGEYAIAAE